jgi:transposase
MTMMVTFGVDAHKRSHTVVATDEAGAELGRLTVEANSDGHFKALEWASRFGQRCWAMEDCRAMTRRFEADLLSAGETVVRVPPKMMAGQRRSARTNGKSDPIDALAVARAALREPDLPRARLDGPSRQIKLVADYRENLVNERTKLISTLRWRLHELGIEPALGKLTQYNTLKTVEDQLTNHPGTIADLALRELKRIREITIEANQLQRTLKPLVEEVAPSLLNIVGCGVLTASKLIGEAADITRFKSRDAYAMWNGTAPIPVWSGNHERFRLNRGGNRQTNAALHRIAITQTRCHPPAQQFIERRTQKGNTKKEAIRSLKRRLADHVYRTMLHDTQQHQTQPKAA